VLFSLGFGPVLIDDGVDVTPEEYPWGEVNDTYARSALGELEPLHYLTMNMNCAEPGTPYYNLATLRQAADAMVARGCRKAYALDGGQTATTVFGGSLINPVQFGWEKEISDIIYFASARGGERKMISP
jgi:exopolysaccharide biosynthesis protein